jgi:hypothetical protein
MSERQPDPEMRAARGEDEPDVEGHKFRAPEKFLGEGVTPEPDDAPDDEAGRKS